MLNPIIRGTPILLSQIVWYRPALTLYWVITVEEVLIHATGDVYLSKI